MQNRKGKRMKEWKDITHYAGFDWAKDHHSVVVVNSEGSIVADFEFEHSLEGWQSFVEKTSAWPNLAVAIETSQGAAVDQLLQRNYAVYPVHPVAAQSYRERKVPTGTKTDHLDAWGLGDALRVDGHGWKALQPLDPQSEQLRLLCRDEVSLIEQRTALANQLQQALLEYYPAALAAFDDWTDAFTWEFILQFPTPQDLVKAGQRRWEKFLHTHKLWRPATTEKRLKLFAEATQFKASDPIVRAKSQLAVSLCKLLRTLEQQLELYRKQIEALFNACHYPHLFGTDFNISNPWHIQSSRCHPRQMVCQPGQPSCRHARKPPKRATAIKALWQVQPPSGRPNLDSRITSASGPKLCPSTGWSGKARASNFAFSKRTATIANTAINDSSR
jgi:hypothetical protein